jgi:hypothetical protein
MAHLRRETAEASINVIEGGRGGAKHYAVVNFGRNPCKRLALETVSSMRGASISDPQRYRIGEANAEHGEIKCANSFFPSP